MPNEILTKTGIGYGTTDNITAIYIGGNSIFEVNIEKRNFEGQNKVAKIEEIPVIKITFYELTLSLIEFLKKSTTSANGVIFYDIDGLYDGVYQSRYEEDEFKQQAILSLYQKYPIEFSPFWMGTLLDLGMPKIFPFGKSNFAINSTEFSLDNSLIEKSVNSEVERFKFSGINRYFFNDSNSWKITINDLAITNSETLLKLKPYKGSMVSFTPHLDRLDIVHHNVFCDYEEKISNNQKSVEISLKQINKTIDRNFVYPPVIYVSGNYIFMQAGINAEVYYTFKIDSWPADPVASNWVKYNTEIELANGYYKAIAKIGDNVSGVVEKEIDLAILAKPSILLISGYIRMLADQGAEIFYTMNRYTQPDNPTSDDTKFTADFAVEYGYYKAIAKKNNKYSTITVQAISPAVVAPPVITKSGDTIVMTAEPFAKIYYTTNGSDPLANGSDSFEYTQPIPFVCAKFRAIAITVNTISAICEMDHEWTPSLIDTALWLDASDLSYITKDVNNLVSRWNDKSGKQRNAIATNGPRFYANKMVFINNNRMTFGEYYTTKGISCIAAVNFDSISNSDTVWDGTPIIIGYTGGFVQDFALQARVNKVSVYCENNTSLETLGNSIAPNNDYILGGFSNPIKTFSSINGTISNISNGSRNDLVIRGIAQDGNSVNFNGNIYEIIIIDGIIDNDTREKIDGYLAWKWDTINGNTALVTALPSNHPYKLSPPSKE